MKKIFAFMMLAAAVAACTLPEDLTPDQPETPKTYTMTIKAAKGVDTKALYFGDGGKLNAKWADGEKVAVKEGDTELGTLTAYPDPTDPAKATLKGSLQKAPSASGVELTLEFNSGSGYSHQNGTLSYIESHTDYAIATTIITIDNENKTITGTPAAFENQNAIVKFTLQDKGSSSTVLTPNIFRVSVMYSISELKSYEFTIDPSVYSSENALYFALPSWATVKEKAKETLASNPLAQDINIDQALESINLKVTATVSDETYEYTRTDTGYPFEAGKYYDITVKMTKQYRTMDKATANDIGKVVGADGKIYINAAEATTASTTAEAMIAYVGKVDGVCNHGLAISLTDVYEYQATLEQAQGNYIFLTWNSSHAVTGATWHLPTLEEWQYMLWSEVVTESTSIVSFQTLLSAVGVELADVDPDGVNFWTNTSGSSSGYQKVIYHRGDFASAQETNAEYCRVRGCLAF